MELRHLRYFVAVAEERSFTRAAERLWIAQPGLSTQIRRLESELGVRLFERHTRGVDLTPAGKLFLERAREALLAAEAAGAIGRDLKEGVVGAVRLGLTAGVAWSGTSALLERFATERPAVELTVLQGHGGTLWRDLRDGYLDALVAPSHFGSADLRRVELGAEPWVVLIGARHRLAGTGELAALDLRGERIFVTAHRDGAGHDRAVASMLEELGITAALVRGAPWPALHGAVARGDALALTTAPEVLADRVHARRLESGCSLSFQLLLRDESEPRRWSSSCGLRRRAPRRRFVPGVSWRLRRDRRLRLVSEELDIGSGGATGSAAPPCSARAAAHCG
jgi:DNA-binding transcriptional LysR family regulator